MKRDLQVIWMNRKGAGCMRHFGSQDDCARFLDTLRCEATVTENGAKVGGVEPNDGRADDRRIKWLWFLEMVRL